jgi:hypothetical protein
MVEIKREGDRVWLDLERQAVREMEVALEHLSI